MPQKLARAQNFSAHSSKESVGISHHRGIRVCAKLPRSGM
jgi:hypothetical protein